MSALNDASKSSQMGSSDRSTLGKLESESIELVLATFSVAIALVLCSQISFHHAEDSQNNTTPQDIVE